MIRYTTTPHRAVRNPTPQPDQRLELLGRIVHAPTAPTIGCCRGK
jgi:hypothetical protein